MAIIRQGILGLFTGKVGDLVGRSRDNVQYVKRLPPKGGQPAKAIQFVQRTGGVGSLELRVWSNSFCQ